MEATDRGWNVNEAPPSKMVPWKNKRTGKIEKVPEGIDPGFDTNPGKLRQKSMNDFLNQKLAATDPAIAEAARRDILDYKAAAAKGGA